jgi:hypothetical protein
LLRTDTWIDNLKMKHLDNNNYGYFEHMKKAISYAKRCFIVMIKLLIHAIYPDIFQDTGWKDLGKR